jgi:acetylornithine/N-succinyldiaminopimelate aminotransferase
LLAVVRGRGPWRVAVLTQPRAAAVQAAAQDAGFLVNAVQPDAVRLAPPLVVTSAQVQALLDVFPALLDAGLERGA